jgi:hypothetical protein
MRSRRFVLLFPAVIDLIANALPGIGLLLTRQPFVDIGQYHCGLAGYTAQDMVTHVGCVVMVIRPMPSYIFAFVMLLLLPMSGGGSRLRVGRHWGP